MKKLNVFWKTVLIILTISVAGIFVYICYRYIDNKYGESWYSIKFNDHFLGQKYVDGRIRLINLETGKATTPKVNWIAYPSSYDTTTVFSKKGKRGYINLITGKIFIPEQFDFAWIFSEGLAGVVKNNRLGFINIKGALVIPYQYQYNSYATQEINFLFRSGLCAVQDTSGKFGLIDKKGTWKLAPEFDLIDQPVKGYYAVKKDGLYGVIDSLAQLIVPVQNELVRVIDEGFLILNQKKQTLYAYDAKTVLKPFMYDDYEELFYNTQQEFGDESHNLYVRSDFTKVRINDKWGVINIQGDLVVPVEYDDVDYLSERTFMCGIDDNWTVVRIN